MVKKGVIGKTTLTILFIFLFLILILGKVDSGDDTTIFIDVDDSIRTLDELRENTMMAVTPGSEKYFIESRNLFTEEEKSMTADQIRSRISELESQANTLEREARAKEKIFNAAAGEYKKIVDDYNEHPCQTNQNYRSENFEECGALSKQKNNDLVAPRATRDEAWDRIDIIIDEIYDIRRKITYYEVWLIGMDEDLEIVTDGSAESYEPSDDKLPEEPLMTEAVKGDGKCELLKEFCFDSQDCKCHKGTRCINNLPDHMDSSTAKQDWIGCVSLNEEIAQIKKQYKENTDKISKLGQDRIILNKLFRQNLGKKIAKFVAIEGPSPTGVLDVVSTVTLTIIQEYFYSEEMTDAEILEAQIKSIQKMNLEMERLYQENQEIKQKFNSLKE
ncbi:MAG: hypothetical protein ABIH37_04850 [archaeon]